LEHKTGTGQRDWYFRVEEFALVDNTPPHFLNTTHFLGEAILRLITKHGNVFNGDLHIKVLASGRCTYPNVFISCGELQLDSRVLNTGLNSVALVEVISDSTEKHDRREKTPITVRFPLSSALQAWVLSS
jgi:hypothetical protein